MHAPLNEQIKKDAKRRNFPRPFRIAIDARSVVSSTNNGIARHTDEIIKGLLTNDTTNFEFILLLSSLSPYNIKDFPRNFSFHVLNHEWSKFKGQMELNDKLKEIKPDLFHSPSYMLPVSTPFPYIVTIHDLIHVCMKHDYSFFHKMYYEVFLRYKLAKANAVITVSQFSKDDILNHYSVDPKNIHVIYNGLSSEFVNSSEICTKEFLDFVKLEYSLPDKFILCVGNTKPHKNLARVIHAWGKNNFEEHLLIVSKVSPVFYQIAETYGKANKLHVPRFIDSKHLPAIYKLASAFVFPSLYEGFGFPPLEALACGIPVVSSDRSSLPEVLGDTVRYINPEDETDMARGISDVLQRNTEVEERIKRGIIRAKQYTWEKTTEQVIEIYEQIGVNCFLRK